jgi:hypothetical protein
MLQPNSITWPHGYGYCHCGCGQKTRIAKQSVTQLGHVRGEPIRFIRFHHIVPNLLPMPERFWSKVNKNGPGGCWIWTACKNEPGYGSIGFSGKPKGAHRVAYELVKGPIPDGLTLDHLCRNTSCVNPDHLEPVTRAENARRIPRATHCPKGHPYDEANTYTPPSGGRFCRACLRAHNKATTAKKKAARHLAKQLRQVSGSL